MRILISILLAVAFAAPLPALADKTTQWVCHSYIALAATDDDTPVYIAPGQGAEVLRYGCYTDANATTPAQLSFEDQDVNNLTGNVTCGENGVDAVTFVTPTAGQYLGPYETLLFDVDNAADTQDYIVCVELQTAQ